LRVASPAGYIEIDETVSFVNRQGYSIPSLSVVYVVLEFHDEVNFVPRSSDY
jgi:hypothetical protein